MTIPKIMNFRIWLTSLKDTYEPRFRYSEEMGIIELLRWIDDHQGSDKNIQMCTGMKDRKGKDVYEGDIVSIEFSPTYTDTFHVIWDKFHGSWAFSEMNRNTSMAGTGCQFYMTDKWGTVVGNIFEGIKADPLDMSRNI